MYERFKLIGVKENQGILRKTHYHVLDTQTGNIKIHDGKSMRDLEKEIKEDKNRFPKTKDESIITESFWFFYWGIWIIIFSIFNYFSNFKLSFGALGIVLIVMGFIRRK